MSKENLEGKLDSRTFKKVEGVTVLPKFKDFSDYKKHLSRLQKRLGSKVVEALIYSRSQYIAWSEDSEKLYKFYSLNGLIGNREYSFSAIAGNKNTFA